MYLLNTKRCDSIKGIILVSESDIPQLVKLDQTLNMANQGVATSRCWLAKKSAYGSLTVKRGAMMVKANAGIKKTYWSGYQLQGHMLPVWPEYEPTQ